METRRQHIEAIALLLSFLLLLLCSVPAFAHNPSSLSESLDRIGTRSGALLHTRLSLETESEAKIIAHPSLRVFSTRLGSYLQQSHRSFNSLFGPTEGLKAEIHLLAEKEFFELTGAPKWTNAMYYRNKILIPINPNKGIQEEQLFRSLRHEYTHAVTHHLSGGRCPGWLDEGIAQWIEGEENPVLNPALRKWLRSNGLIPLTLLGGGFTGLRSEMVAPAYAQSLFAAKYLIEKSGFEGIQVYLSALKSGYPDEKAFTLAFDMNYRSFERLLELELRTWQGKSEMSIAGDLSEVRAMFRKTKKKQ